MKDSPPTYISAKGLHLFSLYYFSIKQTKNARKSDDAITTSTWQTAKEMALAKGEEERKNQINHIFEINLCGSDERHKKASVMWPSLSLITKHFKQKCILSCSPSLHA